MRPLWTLIRWNSCSACWRSSVPPVELSLSESALAVHHASESGEDIEEFDFNLLATHSVA
jgi:hypothetical protein